MLGRALAIDSHAFECMAKPGRGGDIKAAHVKKLQTARHACLGKRSSTHQFIDVLLPELVADVVGHRRCMPAVRMPEVGSPSAGANKPSGFQQGA